MKTKKKVIKYKLKLPKDIKVYFLFYILILKLVDIKISI